PRVSGVSGRRGLHLRVEEQERVHQRVVGAQRPVVGLQRHGGGGGPAVGGQGERSALHRHQDVLDRVGGGGGVEGIGRARERGAGAVGVARQLLPHRD